MTTPARKFRVVTAAAASPISLDEAKAQVRVDGSTDDTILQAFIDAAKSTKES